MDKSDYGFRNQWFSCVNLCKVLFSVIDRCVNRTEDRIGFWSDKFLTLTKVAVCRLIFTHIF